MISKYIDPIMAVLLKVLWWVLFGFSMWFLFTEGLSDSFVDCVIWVTLIGNSLEISKLEKRLDSQATDDNR
jgi:hypothetical protein